MTEHQLKCSKLLLEITSEPILDAAYLWLCKQRQHYRADADVWPLRFNWRKQRPNLTQTLRSNQYYFSANKAITDSQGKIIHLCCASDALVLKAMSLVLGPQWPISPRCTHVKGHGGLKGALRWVHRRIGQHRFVFRTDIKSYYASIHHERLLQMLDKLVPQHDVRRLLTQTIKRTVEWGGLYRDIDRGIGRGSPMSPLFGALFLKPLDDALDQAGLSYVRYMDDIVILTTNRWRCRRASRLLNQVLNELNLEKHPDKTWIGPINRGFDFLGYHHTRRGCRPANTTYARHHAQLSRLYEQGADHHRIGVYQTRWWRWVRGGLPENSVLVEQYHRATHAWQPSHNTRSQQNFGL